MKKADFVSAFLRFAGLGLAAGATSGAHRLDLPPHGTNGASQSAKMSHHSTRWLVGLAS